MTPHPENRIKLSTELDALGQPLPDIQYEAKELDVRSLIRLHEVLGAELEVQGLGKLSSRLKDEPEFPIQFDASHYMGTTRMGDEPETSVVDPNARVHQTDNIYVAGSSVFPTGGCVNPTMTIAALSIRLADHLKRRFVRLSEEREMSVQVDNRTKKKVLLVGSGNRIRVDVLPVLEALGGFCSVTSVWGKTRKLLASPRYIHHVEDFSSITREDVEKADLIYVAVPREIVPSVVESLVSHPCSHATLVLDTPCVHLGAQQQWYECFKEIHVAEDMVYLPWLETLEEATKDPTVGRVIAIEADRSLYQYHGLAFARRLFSDTIGKGRIIGFSKGGSLTYWFGKGTKLVIKEPRNYQNGRIYLRCQNSEFSDRPGKNLTPILLDCEDGLVSGFTIGAVSTRLSTKERELLGPASEDDTVVTRMKDLKRVGLYRLLRKVLQGQATWSLHDGLIDAYLDRKLHKRLKYIRIGFGVSPRTN